MARRVVVEFVAELARFRRSTREGADNVRKLKDESRAAQAEVAKLGTVSDRAAHDMTRSTAAFRRAGEQAGREYGAGVRRGAQASLASGILSGLGEIGGAIPLTGLAAIPATAGAASAALQAIPPLLTAIGGGLGAIPGLAAGAAGSIGTLKLATAGLSDEIEALFETDDPYSQLSANGRRFIGVLAGQRNALLDLRRVAQDRVFAGLDAEAATLARVTLPFATRQVERFGNTWNDTFRQVARVGRDPQFLAGLDDAFAGADRFFDGINNRIPGTSRALGNLFTSSRPFVDAFGDSLLGYLDDFNALIDRAAQDGSLEEWFRDAAAQADALFDIGSEVFTLVGRIAGMSQDSPLLRNMADALHQFNAEAHSMRDVEGIIATGNAAIEGLVQVLLVVGETLGSTLADPATRDAVEAFFDIMTVGAEVVGDVAQAFAALPDGVQSTVLVLAAVLALWGRLQAAGGKLSDAVGRANDRLAATGPAGERAGRGLQTAATWAGRAATAFVALQVAAVVLEQFSDTAVKVTELNRALKGFVETGELSGELTRQFGDDLEHLNKTATAATDGWLQNLGRTAELIPGIKQLNEAWQGGSFTGSVERMQALDAELRNVAESTNDLNGVQDVYNRLLSASGLGIEEFGKLLPETTAWLTDMQNQAHGLTQQQQALNGSMEDAVDVIGGYTQAWRELNGQQLAADEAMLAAKDAIDQVKEAFQENGRAVEGNSRAALENRIAVGQAAQAAAEAAQAKYEETGSVQAASAVYNGYIAALRGTLKQAGLTDAQIAKLIGTYAKIPPSVTTTVTANTAPADAAARALVARINEMRARITVDASTSYGGGAHTGYGYSTGYRWGGVTEHARDGLLRDADLYSPVYPARYAFAEAATGGEAFIPRRGDPERSISIGRTAMEWYDMDVVPKGALRAAWGAAMRASGNGSGSGGGTVTNQYYFQPQQAVVDEAAWDRWQQRQEIRQRINRPR